MRILLVVSTIFLTAATAQIVPVAAGSGVVYYIDMLNGSNSYDGLEQTHTTGVTGPWLDYTNVNSGTFNPDDVIAIRCYADTGLTLKGGRFVLNANHSGTSGHPTRFTSYCSTGSLSASGPPNNPTWTAILDGGETFGQYIAGGGSYQISDSFSSGSYSGSWTNTQGTIGTPASFGISAPPSGATYVAKLTSAQRTYKDVTATATECLESEIGTDGGWDNTKRTYIGAFSVGSANAIFQLMFGSTSDTGSNCAGGNCLRALDFVSSTAKIGTIPIAASSWYKVKACVFQDASLGFLVVWLDANDTKGYQLELAVPASLNFGSSNITRAYMGYPIAGNTAYFGSYKSATGDPSMGANTYSVPMAANQKGTPPTGAMRAWTGVTTVDPFLDNSGELLMVPGAKGTVTNGQFDSEYANPADVASTNAMFYVNVGGSPSAVEVPNPASSTYETINMQALTYSQVDNLTMEHAFHGIQGGQGGVTQNVTITQNYFLNNNGHCYYQNKDAPIQGSDYLNFSYNVCHNGHTGSWAIATSGDPGKGYGGAGIYCTSCRNATIEFNDIWRQVGGAGLQDGADDSVFRYNYDHDGTIMVFITTDKVGPSHNVAVHDNRSVGDTECARISQAVGTLFYNNTCLNYTSHGIFEASTTSTIKNNILWSPSVQAINLNDNTAGAQTTDYNDIGPEGTCFIQSGTLNTCYNTLAAWPGHGAHDVSTNPLIVGGGNLALQSSSPLIGVGTNVGTTYKYGLNPLPPMAEFPSLLDRTTYQWDIGAYVFTGSSPTTQVNATGSFVAH